MPNYYNPYNFYPVSYQPNGYVNPQNTQQQIFTNGPKMMEWVDGEVGAKAFPMPNGWPANSPIPLWDSTDTIIYLKSWGPMGIPSPMQKLHYEMPQQSDQMMLPTVQQNGSSGEQSSEPEYATKEDLDEIRREIKSMMSQRNSKSGSENKNWSGKR